MSILPELERNLLQAARHRIAGAERGGGKALSVRLRGARARFGGMRLAVAAFGVLLASATIALAAGGVFLTGAPVHSQAPQNPGVGNGVPARGASRLLALRVPDPEGGPPWGVRIVSTTRGETCLQVGRLQNGQLGELGVDGAFHDDGRFHPMSAAVLPAMSPVGLVPPADVNTSCELAGKAVAAQHVGIDRSAAEVPAAASLPRSALRDVDYGILGPQAVSVTYRLGRQQVTVPVAAGTYLIVGPVGAHDQAGYGGESIGTYGDLSPAGALTAITYRIDGRLCERGLVQPPWGKTRLANACPRPHWPHGTPTMRDLHQPVHVHLQTDHGLITGMDVSFTAPLAVENAGHEYTVRVPDTPCRRGESGGEGYGEASLDRNVRRGAAVTIPAFDPFAAFGGCISRSATVQVLDQGKGGTGSVLVGSVTLREPVGTKPAPTPRPHRSWYLGRQLHHHRWR